MSFLSLILHFLLLLFLLLASNSLSLLLITELTWIVLYICVAKLGLAGDDMTLMSLPFFFLLFSSIELGFGFLLLSLQLLVNRALSTSHPTNPDARYESIITSLKKFASKK